MPVDVASFANTLFDYVVVGGGTAGLVIAARLAELSNVSVGVIESGVPLWGEPLVDTPARWLENWANPDLIANFPTVPQVHSNGTVLNVMRGKALGGSSALNVMAWTRGSAEDYARWEGLGNPGWDFDSLLPYFEKSETFLGPQPNDSFPGIPLSNETKVALETSQFDGKEGPVQTAFSEWYGDFTIPFVDSLVANGIGINDFTMAGNVTGVTNTKSSVDRKTGTRSYSAPAYLNSSSNPPTVLTSAQASRLVFDTSNKKGSLRATGVEIIVGNKTHTVRARREVIISAGTIETPKFLELSGVGNSTLLTGKGVKTLIDLPGVGENLQEHFGITMGYIVNDGVITNDALRVNSTFAADAYAEYNATRTGFLADSGLAAFSWFPISAVVSAAEFKSLRASLDIELNSTALTPLQRAQYALQVQAIDKGDPGMELFLLPQGGLTGTTPAANTSYATLFPVIGHPFSRGSVHINSTDALALPTIDPNVFASDYDFATLIQAIKFTQRVVATEPVSSLIKQADAPPPSIQTDAEIAAYARLAVAGVSHPIGTAPMAPRDIGGVVDSNLLVYGTSNVRIADASIFPTLISAHTQATVYAVAEKAADIIKAHAAQQ